MTRKISLTLDELGKKLHNAVYSNGKPSVEGTVSLETARGQTGRLDVDRVYDFPFYTATEHCHFEREDVHEFEESGLKDAIASIRQAVYPAVLEEVSSGGYKANVCVRKAIIGKDILVD